MAGRGISQVLRVWWRDWNEDESGVAPSSSAGEFYPTFVAHGYLALLLVGCIVLHVLAALYHQFVRKDRLFRRMWFGRRV
jgi:cytochrome b561